MNEDRPVYVVDDDPMIRRSLGVLLNSAGFSARPYASGRDFLDDVKGLLPGCVLLDIRMPEIDGISVLQRMTDSLVTHPVVIITGHGNIPTAVQCIRLGAADFLEKPFHEKDLLDILERLFMNLPLSVDSERSKKLAAEAVASLTPRQHQVLDLLLDGLTNKQVAKELSLSPRTVDMHRAALLARLGIKSLPEALRLVALARQ